MKLKLDENLGVRGAAQLAVAGHDVATVVSQQLCGARDDVLSAVCTHEGRALVTMDLDFANPLRFPPEAHAGIAVIRVSSAASPEEIERALRTLLAALAAKPLTGQLWIIERDRIREYAREPR